jgi:hypothetical protein
MGDVKRRSRQEVLHYVLSFCTAHIYGREEAEKEYPRTHGGLVGFVSDAPETRVRVGDLVLLSSVGVTKWQLGWLVDTREREQGWPEYLIESIEDGELGWWGNVGIAYLQRRCLQDDWRWTDRQWAFRDRWWKVCYKERGAYIVRPLAPQFGDGFEVILGTRTSHGFDDIMPQRAFPDWRKVTKAAMAQCYDDCVAERTRILAERKAAAEAAALHA